MTLSGTAEILEQAGRGQGYDKSELAAVVVDSFKEKKGVLSDAEHLSMFDILHKLVHEAEIQVRRRLAEEIAGDDSVPRDFAAYLANDEISVAYPILVGSGVLEEADLIEIIRNRSMEHRIAVTRRAEINEAISAALLESEEVPVMVALLENQNAQIAEWTMNYLVDQAKRVDALHRPLVRRSDLSEEMACKLVVWVSAALSKDIVSRFNMDPKKIRDLVHRAALGEISKIKEDRLRPDMAERLAGELERGGMLTPTVALELLRTGHSCLFVSIMKKMTRLEEGLVWNIMNDSRGDSFAIVCRAVGFSEVQFVSVVQMVGGHEEGSESSKKNRLMTLRKLFNKMTPKTAEQVLAKWRDHRPSRVGYVGVHAARAA